MTIGARQFDSIDRLWSDALGYLVSQSGLIHSRVGLTREKIGYQATLTDLNRTWLFNPRRKLSPYYAMGELLWYLSGERKVDRIVPYAPSYFKFCEGDEAFGAYGWRWQNDPAMLEQAQGSGLSQLDWVCRELMARPNSRRAVVTMWNGGDIVRAVANDCRDHPCNLTWQFLHREGKLHMIASMRSNDIWLGLPYDIFVNTCIQRIVASACNLTVGTYTHQVGSLHLYEPNYCGAVEALTPRPMAGARDARQFTHKAWIDHSTKPIGPRVQAAIYAEEQVRETRPEDDEWLRQLQENVGQNSVLYDAVLVCAHKWLPINPNAIRSDSLREAVIQCR